MVKKERTLSRKKVFLGRLITAENRNSILAEIRDNVFTEALENEQKMTYEMAQQIAKEYVAKEKKHLKAFLKGKTYYRSGFSRHPDNPSIRVPNVYTVQFKYEEE